MLCILVTVLTSLTIAFNRLHAAPLCSSFQHLSTRIAYYEGQEQAKEVQGWQ